MIIQTGHVSRTIHYSNVGKGNENPGRYAAPALSKFQTKLNAQYAEKDQQARLEKIRDRLQKKIERSSECVSNAETTLAAITVMLIKGQFR